MKLITTRHDEGLRALLRTTERVSVVVGADRPSPLRAIDWALLTIVGVAGFALGRHTGLESGTNRTDAYWSKTWKEGQR